ncbi:MAG: HAMP domain-containing histidine kinase, partial [Porticoccaceae bacterium]|nr:HAMP domain-containing histidine kinase [Porticoccaceae bacterium]
FFIALAVPTGVLIYQAYSQLKWESFYQHRVMAEELVKRIDQQISQLVDTENKRAFTEYTFLNISGDAQVNFLQRSPLAGHPVNSQIPGVLGYFQIDHLGDFSTPLLPHPIPSVKTLRQDYGLSDNDFSFRKQTQHKIHRLLTDNQLLVHSSADEGLSSALGDNEQLIPGRSRKDDLDRSQVASGSDTDSYELDAPSAQSGFDKLQKKTEQSFNSRDKPTQSLGRIKDLKLENRYRAKLAEAEKSVPEISDEKQRKAKRVLRKEQNVLPVQSPQSILADEPLKSSAREQEEEALHKPISIFESEVDAFKLAILGSGHFVLYRNSWRDGQRYIQGLLVETEAFIDALAGQHFLQTALGETSQLSIAYLGNVLKVHSKDNAERYLSSTRDLQGSLLLQRRLSAPLDDIELLFSVNSLPAGPGALIINWLSVVLLVILSGGLFLIYRLGLRQITLAQQQQNFVSAVSHELKTPLTSIRMYGEILRDGWAPEDRKKTYYDFIYDESERLSRLIDNVLQMARMSRNELQVELLPCSLTQLMDTLQSKISSQVEYAGFELDISCESKIDPELAQQTVLIDLDCFVQIMINLVDNAIKFSAASETKLIDIHCKSVRAGKVQFSVRDYGPGIEKDQMRKIFQLFYRPENELTRATTGTGIGLALAHQLVQAMNGEIDVVNCDPGVEFRIVFPFA